MYDSRMEFWFTDNNEELDEHGQCIEEESEGGEGVVVCVEDTGVCLDEHFFEAICILEEAGVIRLREFDN